MKYSKSCLPQTSSNKLIHSERLINYKKCKMYHTGELVPMENFILRDREDYGGSSFQAIDLSYNILLEAARPKSKDGTSFGFIGIDGDYEQEPFISFSWYKPEDLNNGIKYPIYPDIFYAIRNIEKDNPDQQIIHNLSLIHISKPTRLRRIA